jgi:hypothetical protein
MMSLVVDDVLRVWPILPNPMQPRVTVRAVRCRQTISKEHVIDIVVTTQPT